MVQQLGKMTFASPNSSVNSSSLRLVKLLLSLVPSNITAIKFYSGGSEANEGMLKAARQFWYQSGAPQKQKIIGRYGEGVGGTLACRAVGGLPPSSVRHPQASCRSILATRRAVAPGAGRAVASAI